MKNNKIYILQIFLWLNLSIILTNCNLKDNEEFFDLTFNVKEQIDSTNFKFKIIKLESKKESFLHSISQVKIFQDYIFVLDNNQSRKLLVFTKTGEFVDQIGMLGKGPGEYVYPWSFAINENKNNIAILDASQNKMLLYDLNTFKYLKEVKLNFSATKFAFLKDGNIIWHASHADSYIIITDENGIIIKSLLSKVFKPGITVGNAILNLYKAEDEILFNPPFSSKIFNIHMDSVSCKYNIFIDKHPIISEFELKKFNSNTRDYINYINNSKKAHSFNYYYTTNFIYSRFIIDKRLFIGIYDKQNNKANYISKNNFINSLALPDFYNPIGTYNEWVISVINNFDILDKFEHNHFFNPQIKGSFEQINEDSGFHLLLSCHI